MLHGVFRYADYQDAFIEHLREQPDGRLEYSFDGGWYPADVRTESISVKGVPSPHRTLRILLGVPYGSEL